MPSFSAARFPSLEPGYCLIMASQGRQVTMEERWRVRFHVHIRERWRNAPAIVHCPPQRGVWRTLSWNCERGMSFDTAANPIRCNPTCLSSGGPMASRHASLPRVPDAACFSYCDRLRSEA